MCHHTVCQSKSMLANLGSLFKASLEVSGQWGSLLEALGKNPLPSSFVLLAEFLEAVSPDVLSSGWLWAGRALSSQRLLSGTCKWATSIFTASNRQSPSCGMDGVSFGENENVLEFGSGDG